MPPVFVKLKPGFKTSSWNPTAKILDVHSIKENLIQALIDGVCSEFLEVACFTKIKCLNEFCESVSL